MNTLTYLLAGILVLFLIGGSGFGVGQGLSVQTATDFLGFYVVVEVILLVIALIVSLVTLLLPIIAVALAVYAGSKLLKGMPSATGVMEAVKEQPGIYQLIILAAMALLIL